ncbi:hypothetical protein QBC37DRAFT_404521 [Rhypophila decipiens]|uniref:Uncharacterized protein n=1 Tax=Rhypophila decipiens TaxID=261697 RepID=A0AAN7B1G3_9PEZI|nr:hypothetical protein QBC37DRAFT_404521 [Rhypophila decipiens]
MARLSSLLTICAHIFLSIGAVIDPVKAPDPNIGQRHQVIARQDDIPLIPPAEALTSITPTVTTPAEVPAPNVAIAAVEPTAPGQIGVNPPTAPKIELHTSFTDEPMTVTLKGAATPTVAPALVTAVVAEGYLNIGLAPKLADKLQEIAQQIPPCGGALAKRHPVKVKGRQVAAPACGFDGFASRVAQETELTDWALLEAQLDQALTGAMNWGADAAAHVIQLVSSGEMTAVWASLSSQRNIVTAGAGLVTWQLFKTMYESLHLNAVSSMKGIALHPDTISKTETEYKTDDKCKKEEKDRTQCKKDDCKGDKNNFCTTGDQTGCPCKGSEIRQIGQMRPPSYAEAFANLPIVPLFDKESVLKAPECDSAARFNYPLNDWKVMALAFSNGPAKDLGKEAITAYNGTYKFTFGWFPKSESKCSTSSVNPMLNYMVDDPSLNCREGSVENTLLGSGKMETDCGTIKWSIKMSDNTVIVDPVLGGGPPPTTGLDSSPRFCYDPKAEAWTGKKVVKATLEKEAKKACEAFAAKGPVQFKPDEAVRLYPVPKPAGVTTDYIDGVLYGFRVDWNRGREGCSAEELAKIPGGSLQEILPADSEGDGSCVNLMVQAWEKCDAQYGGNMGGFYDVGCLQYSFRPDNPMPHIVPKTPLEGGDN